MDWKVTKKWQNVGIEFEMGLTEGTRLEISKRNEEAILKPIEDDLEKMFEQAKNVKPKKHLSASQMDDLNEGVLR